jgi:hypothetical protein
MDEREEISAALLEELAALPPSKTTVVTWDRFQFGWRELDLATDEGHRISELVIRDEDSGDRHHFRFSEPNKAALIEKMTGGVILP